MGILFILIAIIIYMVGFLHSEGQRNDETKQTENMEATCNSICDIKDMMFFDIDRTYLRENSFICTCTTEDLDQKSFRVNLGGKP